MTEENIVTWIDNMETDLDQSQRLNFLRWPMMNQYVHQNPKLWGSYQAEVENVRRFMKERLVWMDKRLGYDYQAAIATVTVDLARAYQVFTLSG
jgi:hypothetical protein